MRETASCRLAVSDKSPAWKNNWEMTLNTATGSVGSVMGNAREVIRRCLRLARSTLNLKVTLRFVFSNWILENNASPGWFGASPQKDITIIFYFRQENILFQENGRGFAGISHLNPLPREEPTASM